MDNFIIGFTGAFGSGCSFLSENFLVKKQGFIKYSLSDILKEEYKKENEGDYKNRHQLQEYGNHIRQDKTKSYLAERVFEKIKTDIKNPNQKIIIDSFRNPAEVEFIRKHCTKFFLIAVFADKEVRWDRVSSAYSGKYDEFCDDDIKDQGSSEPGYGQKVSNCFFLADLILANNKHINCEQTNTSYNEMKSTLDNYVAAFTEPETSHPSINETLMAIAYTNGRRSKCTKRKVGAIIVDSLNNILSSGFNDVPVGLEDCAGKHGLCYRDQIRRGLIEEYTKLLNGDSDLAQKIVKRIKMLELCRALHAEENAILNLVRSSSRTDFSDCTLYATTYPCNLCANKIVQTGIKKVIYFEPYPVKEAKEIFEQANVKADPFQGITFRAFFKAFNFEVE